MFKISLTFNVLYHFGGFRFFPPFSNVIFFELKNRKTMYKTLSPNKYLIEKIITSNYSRTIYFSQIFNRNGLLFYNTHFNRSLVNIIL